MPPTTDEEESRFRRAMGARILALRNAKKMTSEQVGLQIGFSGGALRYWENGVNEPPASALLGLATLFNVTIDYIVGRPGQRDSWLHDSAVAEAQAKSESWTDPCWRVGEPFFKLDTHVWVVSDEERTRIAEPLRARWTALLKKAKRRPR